MKKIVFFLFVVVFSLGAWGVVSYNITGTGSNLTLTISGSGAMDDYATGGAPWYSNRSKIKTIIIEEGVTYIGSFSFESTAATTVTIPTSVKKIGEKAFMSCATLVNLHASSPNDWASIELVTTKSGTKEYPYSHPFYGSTGTRHYYFYGNSSPTTILVFTPGIEVIRKYTFVAGESFTSLNLPGSVKKIEKRALYCEFSNAAINRSTPPELETEALSFVSNPSLYLPTSHSGYSGSPWSSGTVTNQDISGSTLGTKGENVKWDLDANGVLTLDATAAGASKNITIDAASVSDMPWYYFRRLVYKLKIKGEITALNNTLHYHYGISEIVLDQQTIPTISTTYIATGSSTPYASLFNTRDKLTLRVKLSSILSATESAKLETAPWNDGHWQIAISDEVQINDNDDEADDLLAIIKDKVDVPFTMQLGRTMSSEYYNTFCSPIPLDAATIASKFGAGTDVRELTSTEYDAEANELTLNFTQVSAIEAGHPYLILPGTATSNPTFDNVDPDDIVSDADNDFDITGTPASYITSHGILAPYTPSASEYGKTFLFLLAGNKLTWASSGTLKGMRAFFKVKDGAPEGLKKAAAIMRMPNVATGIDDVYVTPGENTSLSTNVQKIMRDGQLLIIRDGKIFNAQGQLVE